MVYADYLVWNELDTDDLWIYDKLIVSRKLGYLCGPQGVEVPRPDHYMVKPITNISGMGRKARFEYLECDTDHLHPGEMWCEIFEGDHYSFDYVDKQQVLCVQGIRGSLNTDLTKWGGWKRSYTHTMEFPQLLNDVNCKYINIETIGGNIIEVHARLNPDWHGYQGDEVIPLYEPPKAVPNGYTVIQDSDDTDIRWGMMYKDAKV